MGLRAKFLYLLLGLAAGFLIYVHLVVLPPVSEHTLQVARASHQDRLDLTAEAVLPHLLESDLANVYTLLNAIKHDNEDWLQLMLFNAEGKRLYPLSQPPELDGNRALISLETDVGFLDPAIGRLVLVLDMSPVLKVVKQLELSLQISLLILLGVMLIAVWVQVETVIRRPLAQMIAAAHKLMHGDFSAPLPAPGRGEIGELSHTFDDMRGAIKRHHIDMNAELKTRQQEADELKAAKQQAEFDAKHDPLTGMINRREFHLRLAAGLHDIQRHSEQKHVLMFIDLDHFKAVNDTCGHAAGDELLKVVASIMRKQIRERDELGRMGGDEFAILLHGCDLNAGCRVAAAICDAVRNLHFECGDQMFQIGASIGVLKITEQAADPEIVMKQADTACYQAKHQGRGRYVVYSSGSECEPYVDDSAPVSLIQAENSEIRSVNIQ